MMVVVVVVIAVLPRKTKKKEEARKPNLHSLLGGNDTVAYHLLYAIDQDRLNSVRATRLNQQ